jgi:hypothetical protein
MPIQIVAEKKFVVGKAVVIQGMVPNGTFGAVFEDDGETGYFYALDASVRDQTVRDALHIYDVESVIDRTAPATVRIGWSVDNTKAVLLINDYPHAVFDFQARRGYCRTGFPLPAPDNQWSTQGHDWDEACIALFE